MNIRSAFLIAALLLAAGCTATPAPAAPSAATPAPSACVVVTGFQAETPESAARHLLGLAHCLEDPDPAVRDGYAFESLSGILRNGTTPSETLRILKADLLGRLATAGDDPNGFRGPFAILALAEVARTDRIAPWMTEAERSTLIAAAHTYLAGLTDYRGFSDTEGWRHGVAHTADLLMQLSLNPALTRPQADAILAAIALKVGTTEHAYIFGESERLAAPVLYLARTPYYSESDWTAWFGALWPADDPLRENAYRSQAALTRLHNLRAFSEAVYVSASVSSDDAFKPVAAGAVAMLSALP